MTLRPWSRTVSRVTTAARVRAPFVIIRFSNRSIDDPVHRSMPFSVVYAASNTRFRTSIENIYIVPRCAWTCGAYYTFVGFFTPLTFDKNAAERVRYKYYEEEPPTRIPRTTVRHVKRFVSVIMFRDHGDERAVPPLNRRK